MINLEKIPKIWKPETIVDSKTMERSFSYISLNDIESRIVITNRTGSINTINNSKTVDSEYIGVGYFTTKIKPNYQLEVDGEKYHVDYVDDLGRKTIVYLSLVENFN